MISYLSNHADILQEQFSILDADPFPPGLASLIKGLLALEFASDITRQHADYVRAPIFQHVAAYGTRFQSWDFLSRLEPRGLSLDDLPSGGPSRLVFRRPDWNPGLPSIPGQPGVIIATSHHWSLSESYNESTSLFVGLPKGSLRMKVSTQTLPERWRYMGEYQQFGQLRPMTAQEFRSLPQSVSRA